MDSLKIYSIFDVGLDKYSVPFFAQSDIEAHRRFTEMMFNVPRSLYISNFQLEVLGVYSIDTGSIEVFTSPEVLLTNNELFYKDIEARAAAAGVDSPFKS